MDKVIIQEDVVNFYCAYLRRNLEDSTFKFRKYYELNSVIGELCADGFINYKERDEIRAKLKTIYDDIKKRFLAKTNVTSA